MMKCTALVGSREERKAIILDLRQRPARHNIVVTSFSMLDDEGVVTALKDAVPSWQAIVVDEAHHLKNASTKRFQRVSDLEGEFRVLLTGTPVQNSVGEMLSLLRFAASDLFAGAVPETDAFVLNDGRAASDGWDIVVEAFVEELQALTEKHRDPEGVSVPTAADRTASATPAAKPAAATSSSAAAAAAAAAATTPVLPQSTADAPHRVAGDRPAVLDAPRGAPSSTSLIDTIRRIMQPFILQRTKADVSLGLPPKLSRVECIPMLPEQGKLYAAIVETLRLLAARRAAPASTGPTPATVSSASEASAKAGTPEPRGLPTSGPVDAASASAAERRRASCEAHRQRLLDGPFVGGVTSAVLAGSQSSLPGALMLMRRAAGHPALLRSVYPDKLALALVKAAHFLDRLRDAKADDPDATSAADDAVGRVKAIAAELGVGQTANRAGEIRFFAETGKLFGEDGDHDDAAPPGATQVTEAMRVRTALIPAASQVGPTPSLADLGAWAEGNRALAKEGEQVLGMSDFELSEQLCAFYPELDCWRLPDQYLLSSSKVRETLRRIQEVRARGSKVLVFSQFNIVLDILEAVLRAWGQSWLRLDGSTAAAERQERCDAFCSDPGVGVFLLTTRAGGLGLNLVAADTVILFDCDWNPQNDRQAEDRAHRMGQTRPVNVIRLASKGSIEERMLRVAESKRQLERVILDTPSQPSDKDILDAMMREELLGGGEPATGEPAGNASPAALPDEDGASASEPLPRKRPRMQSQVTAPATGTGGYCGLPPAGAKRGAPAARAATAAPPADSPRWSAKPLLVERSLIATPPASPKRA
ncbi:hypothetical protein FNF27_01964 [Cafeteria roenbergensis]|uniref:Helicase n=1 Tax=Cafeteria roenbergensis TaxID=33653 RepID=A0A5A8DW54_CAFRO|nr:hypothetical protein FNF31_00055 [Cafeteria roenbergensis]KAA0176683.1 hypothetical protein FNF27_01964 [Cafeteria roenbergensis]